MPAISQWPVVVSFPFERNAHLPNDPRGSVAGGTPRKGRTFPKPQLCRFGKLTMRDSQICPSVSEPASPHSGASGIAPMPAPSRTIKVTRLNLLIGRFYYIYHLSFDISHLSFRYPPSGLN